MAYAGDKQIFVRHYRRRNKEALPEDAAAAWRVYFIARRVETYGETVAAAERAYETAEAPKSAYIPNPERHELAGGFPFEHTAELMVHYGPGEAVFAGALLEDKHGRQVLEVTGRPHDRLYRISVAAPFFTTALGGSLRDGRVGFIELEALVLRLADDPEAFRRLAAVDRGVDAIACMPRAAVLARWGPEGERAAKQL